MAYLLDDEEQKQQAAGQQGAASGTEQVMTGPSAGVITPGSTGGGATSQAAPAQKAGGNIGGFTNLQSYVTANQGNDAAMGQKVTGVVDHSAKNSDTAVSNFTGAGSAAVDKGTVKYDDGLVNQLYTNPGAIAGDTSKRTALAGQLGATYGGPKDATEVAGYQDAQTANDGVTSDLKSARGGNEDRQGLLDKAYGRSSYSSGEKGLDSFLLGAGEGGRQSLNDIQKNYGDREGAFDRAADGVTQQIGAGQATTAETKSKANSALQLAGSSQDSLLDQYAGKLAQNNLSSNQTFNQLQSYLGSGDAATRAKGFDEAGIDRGAGEAYVANKGDARNLVQAGGVQSLGDVLSPEQIMRYEALKTLGYGGKYGGDGFAKSGTSGNAFERTADANQFVNNWKKDQAAKAAADEAARIDAIRKAFAGSMTQGSGADILRQAQAQAQAAADAKSGALKGITGDLKQFGKRSGGDGGAVFDGTTAVSDPVRALAGAEGAADVYDQSVPAQLNGGQKILKYLRGVK